MILTDINGQPLGNPSAQQVKPIRITDNEGRSVVLNPQSGITAIEAMHISLLLFRLTHNRDPLIPDWREYIERHNLGRHFVDGDAWQPGMENTAMTDDTTIAAELEVAHQKILNLQQSVDRLMDERDSARAAVDDKHKLVEMHAAEHEKARADVVELNQKVAELEAELAAARTPLPDASNG